MRRNCSDNRDHNLSHLKPGYDAGADVYRCPGSALLRRTPDRKRNTGGRIETRYVSRKAVCEAPRNSPAILSVNP